MVSAATACALQVFTDRLNSVNTMPFVVALVVSVILVVVAKMFEDDVTYVRVPPAPQT